VQTATNVLPFQIIPVVPAGGNLWNEAQRAFQDQDAPTFAAWIARLSEEGREGGTLCLIAPSQFHKVYVETHLSDRLLRILRRLDPSLNGVRIRVQDR
jgi:chromosomal replication initiation ATPase DnaA